MAVAAMSKATDRTPLSLTPGRRDRGENSAVCPCRIPVERERIKDGLGSLKAICRRARSSGSLVAWGPAASSAMVSALTETSMGSCVESSWSRSINHEASRLDVRRCQDLPGIARNRPRARS